MVLSYRGGNSAPVLELAEQALDEIAPAVFRAIVRNGYAAIAFGGDDHLDAGCGKFCVDGVGIIALVGEQCLDAVTEHPELRAETLHVVCLTRRQDEAERPTMPIAAGVQFGGEADARPARPLGLLIPFF